MSLSLRRFTGLALFAALLFVGAGAGLAHAQTAAVSDPNTLVFTPSADHNVLLSDGRRR